MWRIHEGRVLDLLPDVLVLVEGEGAGKTHLGMTETSFVRKEHRIILLTYLILLFYLGNGSQIQTGFKNYFERSSCVFFK